MLHDAFQKGLHIVVVGDFDADGATSTALSVLALRALGYGNVSYLVPNRFEDGYGLSPEVVDQAHARGAQMIMTVDNGISSHAGVDHAHALGIPVLVTDHHLPGETLPAAEAIVNPNLRDCDFPSKSLAGVGVAFYLMLALRTFCAIKAGSTLAASPRRTLPSCWIWWRLAPSRTSCRWMLTTVSSPGRVKPHSRRQMSARY